jgi:hypothetical protein
MVIETALVKPVVDALIGIFEKARGIELKSSAFMISNFKYIPSAWVGLDC